MDREEAIDLLDNLIGFIEDNHDSDYDKALKMAIEALKQEPVLDKIRAEIRHHSEHFINDDGEDCLALYEDDVIEIIDKYRKEQE